MQVKGVEWRRERGVTAKALIRIDPQSKRAYREAVTWLNPADPFCGGCLSTAVVFNHETAVWHCSECQHDSDAPSVTF